MRQPLTISGGLVLLVTLAAFSARLGVPWTLRQALYAGAALLEAVGLVMVAWPDIEAKASAYRIDAIRRMRAFVHSLPRRLGRAREFLVRQSGRPARAVTNWYRRLRGQPLRIDARIGGVTATATAAALAASVRRHGTIEERLSRVETELAEYPSRWRGDFASFRDDRVAYRWIGLPMIFLGILLNLWATYAS